MGKRALLIVNSSAGVDRNKEEIIKRLASELERRDIRFDVEFSASYGEGAAIARKAAEEAFDIVLAGGGDGTVNDVANGLWGRDVPLGVIPLGSGNGLARSLGIPMEIDKAIKTALDGSSVKIDRGMVNRNPFYCSFGSGFDAEVGYKFSQDKRRGKMTYVKHAIKEIFTYKPARYKIKTADFGVETEAMLVAVCNCRQYGNNAYIAPGADIADGLLDVMVVHSGNFFTTAKAGLDLFSGKLDQNILVETFRVKHAVIEMESRRFIHLDGEPMEGDSRLEFRCEPAGLEVMVNADYKDFIPYVTPFKSMWSDFINDIIKISGEW